MKKQILSLMVGAAVFAISPAFAMDEAPDLEPKGPTVSQTLTNNEREDLSERLKELQKNHEIVCSQIDRLNIKLNPSWGKNLDKPILRSYVITHETKALDERLSSLAMEMREIEGLLGIEGNFSDAAVKEKRQRIQEEIFQEMLQRGKEILESGSFRGACPKDLSQPIS